MNKLVLSAFLLLTWSAVHAQGGLSWGDTVALNPQVRTGVLPNGLTYYILRHHDAQQTIALQLVVKTGSMHCGGDELGAAHLVEHLGLRSTNHFPGGLMKALLGLGHANVTAKTGGIYTNYALTIAGGDSVLLRYGLLAVRDWAQGRLYLSQQVEEERAAVLNEVAMASAYKEAETRALLDNMARFVPKLEDEILSYKTLSIEALRRFDRKWYRPERQAVIVVGDIDEVDMERRIAAVFSGLQGDVAAAPPALCGYTPNDDLLTRKDKLAVVAHGLVKPVMGVEIIQKRKTVMGTEGPATLGQFRTRVMDDLYNELVRQRMDKISHEHPTIFRRLANFVHRDAIHPLAGLDALTTVIELDQVTQVKTAMILTMKELHKIARWGFTDHEFTLAKGALLRRMNGAWQAETAELKAIALASYFVGKASFPENTLLLDTTLLNGVGLNEINTMARAWIDTGQPTDIVLSVPDVRDPHIPDERTVFGWRRQGMRARIRRDAEPAIRSLPPPPVPVHSAFERRELEDIAATQLTLPNGVKIVIKRLGAAADNPWPDLGDVALKGFRAGGLDLYDDADYPSAAVAADLVRASGIATLDDRQLKDWLKDRTGAGALELFPYILDSEACFGGHSSLAHVEQLFHLLYLYFAAPRMDQAVFNRAFRTGKGSDRQKSDAELFNDSIQNMLAGGVTRKAGGTARFSRASRIYRERFSSARGFTFVITGYFDTEELIPYVVRYFGALPSITGYASKAPLKHGGLTQPVVVNKDLRVTMVGDSTGLALVRMLLTGRMEATVQNKLLTQLILHILNPLLLDRLRVHERGVYAVTAGGGFPGESGDFLFNIQFETEPGDVERLSSAVVDELKKITRGELDDVIFENARAATHAEIANDLIDADYVGTCIADRLRRGYSSCDGLKRAEILHGFTKQDVISLIRDSLDTEHYLLFKLL